MCGVGEMCTPERRLFTILAAFAMATGWLFGQTRAEEANAPAPRGGGIEHVLHLSVSSDPGSPLLTGQRQDGEANAVFKVFVEVSAHSQETNFFGVVPAVVPSFDLLKGSSEREIWRDARCHHERGYPRFTVIGVDGLVANGSQKAPVSARRRKLGTLLPGDEVLAARGLTSGKDDRGSYIATRTETRKSRLFVDLKLYIVPCYLSAPAKAD
jgi:hypothetical protein